MAELKTYRNEVTAVTKKLNDAEATTARLKERLVRANSQVQAAGAHLLPTSARASSCRNSRNQLNQHIWYFELPSASCLCDILCAHLHV